MHTIFFSNAPIVNAVDAGECQCVDFYDALVVYNALCRRFLAVELYDADGNKLRAYNNLFCTYG